MTPAEKLEVVVAELADNGAPVRSLETNRQASAEATYTMRDGGSTMFVRHRIYHKGSTVYQVMVVEAGGERSKAEAERFFNSFELLENPP